MGIFPFFQRPKHERASQAGSQSLSVSFFPRVTADRPFTNVPTDLIAADTNNVVHILSTNASNALGIITMNTNNYC